MTLRAHEPKRARAYVDRTRGARPYPGRSAKELDRTAVAMTAVPDELVDPAGLLTRAAEVAVGDPMPTVDAPASSVQPCIAEPTAPRPAS